MSINSGPRARRECRPRAWLGLARVTAVGARTPRTGPRDGEGRRLAERLQAPWLMSANSQRTPYVSRRVASAGAMEPRSCVVRCEHGLIPERDRAVADAMLDSRTRWPESCRPSPRRGRAARYRRTPRSAERRRPCTSPAAVGSGGSWQRGRTGRCCHAASAPLRSPRPGSPRGIERQSDRRSEEYGHAREAEPDHQRHEEDPVAPRNPERCPASRVITT